TQFTYAMITSGSASGTLLGLKCSLNTIAIPTDASTLMPLPGSYVITLTTIVAGIVQNGTYVKSFSYTYDYVRPVVTISQSVNGFIPRYYSTDTTTYMVNAVQPTITRTHNIDFPAASMIPSETFVTQAVEINPPKLWNGIYTTTISSLLSYTMSDNLIILDKVFNAQTFTVSINVDLCRINCCMNNLNDKYQAALSNNTYQSVVYGDQLARATQLISLYRNNIECGNAAEANNNLNQIYAVTGCSPDCGCDAENGQVVPYNGIVGKTILEYDPAIPNSQFDYIDFQSGLWRGVPKNL